MPVSSPSAGTATHPVITLARCVNDAVVSTFESICGARPAEVKEPDGAPAMERVVALISFSGTPPFVFMLALGEQAAGPLVRTFTGMEIEFSSPDMGDCIGELVNVIAGDVVAQVERAGMSAQMGLPTVARGKALGMIPGGRNPSVETRFDLAEGPIWVKVAAAR